MQRERLVRTAAWAAALVVLSSVFTLYMQPDFLVVLSNQVWGCF